MMISVAVSTSNQTGPAQPQTIVYLLPIQKRSVLTLPSLLVVGRTEKKMFYHKNSPWFY